MPILISPDVRLKLARKTPPVRREEIQQCFANRTAGYLEDEREQNQTDPPTLWFVAETDFGRKLKVALIFEPDDITIKTAYDASALEIEIYELKAPR